MKEKREGIGQQQTDERMIYMAIACFVLLLLLLLLLHISQVNQRSATEMQADARPGLAA